MHVHRQSYTLAHAATCSGYGLVEQDQSHDEYPRRKALPLARVV